MPPTLPKFSPVFTSLSHERRLLLDWVNNHLPYGERPASDFASSFASGRVFLRLTENMSRQRSSLKGLVDPRFGDDGEGKPDVLMDVFDFVRVFHLDGFPFLIGGPLDGFLFFVIYYYIARQCRCRRRRRERRKRPARR
jgi:hypothetical protein